MPPRASRRRSGARPRRGRRSTSRASSSPRTTTSSTSSRRASSAPTTSTPTRGCACQRGRRLQATLGAERRRPATKTSITPTAFHRRQQRGLGAPGAVPAHRGRKRARPGAEDRRRRPAPHRDRGGRRPASADRPGHRRRAVQRHAARDALGRPGSTARYIARAHQRLRGAEGDRCASTRRATPRASAACGETNRAGRALVRAHAPATLSLYCQGLNQSTHGTAKNAALINLHLATGQIGRPGAGPFSLTGQPNAMGGREVGGMANLLPAHRDLANPAHRAEIARALGRRRRCRRARQDRGRDVRGRGRGEIKALWIACTNPAQSMPDQAWCAPRCSAPSSSCCRRRSRDTATARSPTCCCRARSWGEKDGTVTNSERRISRVRAAVPPPGEARARLAIAADFARRLQARLRPGRADAVPVRPTPKRSGTSTASRRAAATSTSAASTTRSRARRPAAVAVSRGRDDGRARLYADGRFPTAERPRALHRRRRTAPPAEPPTRATRSRSTPGACATSGTA